MAKEDPKDTEGEENDEAESEVKPKKSKKALFLGGGMVSLIATAYIGAMVAFPGEVETPRFDGPFLTDLSGGDIQVNLRGDAGRRYLVMTLRAEYEGYDETYVARLVEDPVYQAKIQNELIGLARQKTREDVADQVGLETLLVEIQEAVAPLIFPLHVGNGLSTSKVHEESGLRPGSSSDAATMRGGFMAHQLHVDGIKRMISLDNGPKVQFEGTEDDLRLASENGMTVFVDLTGMKEEFSGDVNVGTFGRVLSILKGRFLIQ